MEHANPLLVQAAIYFAAAVVAVLIAQRLGLGSVAGYLLAGIAIGPWGLKLVGETGQIRAFAELGVVFLLFVIGLELEPKRLWTMRGRLLGLGLSQVMGSIAAIALVGVLVGVDPRVAIIAGMALSLSSTALALAPLTERGGLATQGGQATFAILLFQDLAVIPMLALLPLLGAASRSHEFSLHEIAYPVMAVIATLVVGHYLVRPVFRHIARTRLREIFTAFALLLVIGIAVLYEVVGLSMALGAFLAGVLLAESEYRHEIEAAVEPFKGLLLGLFFISVGMGVDFALLLAKPLVIVGLIVGLFLVKGAVLWLIARTSKMPRPEQPLFILLLAQGGEFAFVLLGPTAAGAAMPPETAQAVILAVALSMLLTPFILVAHDRWIAPRMAAATPQRAAETPEAAAVIVAGLGRVGQVVARLLNASGYQPTVLDDDPDHVEASRKFGFRVFYGDATRLDLLHAAGADTAKFLIVALDDAAATTKLAKTVRKHFPQLRVIARARDMRHMFELRDLGVETIERETFRSALALGEAALTAIGGDPERAARAAQAFAAHDTEVVSKLYDVHRRTPDAHITVSNELRDQLARTLQADATPDEPDAERRPAAP
ncbi:MAG TPA: monovalent cation:proton antiporter-2 (CPA2) family protein [Burkholderiales bacterium]|nr:monovalent cation:proton antiporter-2 (CPA2) family protein [Burkholderiales bacterium]